MSVKYVAADVYAATTSLGVRDQDGRVTMAVVVETRGDETVSLPGNPGHT